MIAFAIVLIWSDKRAECADVFYGIAAAVTASYKISVAALRTFKRDAASVIDDFLFARATIFSFHGVAGEGSYL